MTDEEKRVVDELEKIAEEMKSSNRYSFEDLKIIDKRIAEIKGE